VEVRSESGAALFWLLVLSFWVVSFVSQHDLYFALEAQTHVASDLSGAVEEGNLVRQLALIGFAALSAVVVLTVRRSDLITIDRSLLGLLVVYFAWMACSVAWSDAPELSLRRILGFGCYLVGAVAVAALAFSKLRRFVICFCSLNLLLGF